MKEFSLYRKRIIPKECILLKDDEILSFDENRLVTRWNVLHPKKDLHHGISCFFLDEGWKISKFYDQQNRLLYWYIDIISYLWTSDKEIYNENENNENADNEYKNSNGNNATGNDTALCVTDLLTDVIIYPDGFVKVVDIDELSDALESGDIDTATLCESLRKLDGILKLIYSGEFQKIAAYVERFE